MDTLSHFVFLGAVVDESIISHRFVQGFGISSVYEKRHISSSQWHIIPSLIVKCFITMFTSMIICLMKITITVTGSFIFVFSPTSV